MKNVFKKLFIVVMAVATVFAVSSCKSCKKDKNHKYYDFSECRSRVAFALDYFSRMVYTMQSLHK